jgi:redox-sensitive bicupin YhaK (pirin superfamily)
MVAGRGVTHSERTTPEGRSGPQSLLGVQTWVALPESHEDMAPTFEHHGKESLPVIWDRGVSVRLILGRAYGENAPATMFSDSFYADVALEAGRLLPMPDDHEDRGIYIIEGSILIAGQEFSASRMMVFRPGDKITVAAGSRGARLMILGGATLGGPRYIWWNFVASSRERIEEAKAQWRAQNWGEGRFDLPINDRNEHIPLPD